MAKGTSRHATRRIAVQCLYQALVQQEARPLKADAIMEEYLAWRARQTPKPPVQLSFLQKIIFEAARQKDDEKDDETSLSVTARAIIMAARSELAADTISTPRAVVLSEYVTLAAQLCDDGEVAVINGCLDS